MQSKSIKGIIILICGVIIMAGCGILYCYHPEIGQFLGYIAFVIGGGTVFAGIMVLAEYSSDEYKEFEEEDFGDEDFGDEDI